MDFRKKSIKTEKFLIVPVFERLIEYSITYTTYSKMKNVTPENILSQYQEKVISPKGEGINDCIKNYCKENFPEYKFEEKQSRYGKVYQSNEINKENVHIIIEEVRRISIDTIVVPNDF